MGKRTYTALSMYIERRGWGGGERTVADSIKDVKRRMGGWGGKVTEEVEDGRRNRVNG